MKKKVLGIVVGAGILAGTIAILLVPRFHEAGAWWRYKRLCEKMKHLPNDHPAQSPLRNLAAYFGRGFLQQSLPVTKRTLCRLKAIEEMLREAK